VAEGQLALLVETNHLGDSKHSWPPPCTDTILTETCHRIHDRSYRSGGRDEQAADLFTQKLDGVAWRSKPSSYIVATIECFPSFRNGSLLGNDPGVEGAAYRSQMT